MKATDWEKSGVYHFINKYEVFTVDTGLAISGEAKTFRKVMVFLHGYPTSTYDYHKVISKLSEHYRVIMHDHLGFGFSDKPKDYSYSLMEQADMALALWKKLGLKKVILLAHDYGTSVATEILARDNAGLLDIKIEKLILCNGSMHIELSQLRTIQKLLKHRFWGKYVAMLTNYSIFKKNLRNVYYDKSKITDQELRSMWHQLEYKKGRRVIHKLSQYINERYKYWDRWIGALKETRIPTRIVWAENDPVAIPAIAELLATEIPNNELYWIENTGHFPMLESPEIWVKLILR